MSKRFDIKLGLEELDLEVDKVVEENAETKTADDTTKVLDNAVEAVEETKKEEESTTPEESTPTDAPVEVEKDETTLDGAPTEETPPTETSEETKEEVTDETPPEETKEEKTEESSTDVKEEADDKPAEEPKTDEVEETKTKEESTEEKPATEEINEAVLNDSTSLTDVADAVRENEQNIDEVDEAINVTTSLEEIAEQLEASLDTGGITEGAAAITDIATKRLYERVGLTQPESEEIAVEGFKTPSSRIRNTKLAIENISDKISNIFKAIVAAINRSIEWIKKFINSFFKNFDSMKEKIKKLREAFSKVDKSTAVMLLLDKEKFDKESIINKLKAGPSTSIDVAGNISSLTKFSEDYFKSIETGRTNVLKNIQTIISNAKESKQELPDSIVLSFGLPNGMQGGNVPGYSAPENLDTYATIDDLPNDSVFIAYVPVGGLEPEDYKKAVSQVKFFIGSDQRRMTNISSLPILLENEVTDTLDALDKLCEEGNKAKVTFNNFVKDKEAIKRDLDSLIKSNYGLTDKVKEAFNKVKDGSVYKAPSKTQYGVSIMTRIQAIEKTYIHGSSLLSQLMINTVSAGVSYTSDCIQKYVDANKTVKQSTVTP